MLAFFDFSVGLCVRRDLNETIGFMLIEYFLSTSFPCALEGQVGLGGEIQRLNLCINNHNK
jgi:hypothetical protein